VLLFANITAALIFMRRFAQEEPLTPWFDRLMLLGAAFGALSACTTYYIALAAAGRAGWPGTPPPGRPRGPAGA
jgi:hypothetical protein